MNCVRLQHMNCVTVTVNLWLLNEMLDPAEPSTTPCGVMQYY